MSLLIITLYNTFFRFCLSFLRRQESSLSQEDRINWIPAFAGMIFVTSVTIIFFTLFLLPSIANAETLSSRYFYSGDGKINITSAKNGISFSGIYRNKNGTYNTSALKKINAAFQAKYGNPAFEISPRLIEFLVYIENQLKPGAKISIASGFRSPEYNTKLRANGKLAAKASLHQYGMAADVKFSGLSSEQVWNYVKELGFGGAGFYHGGLVHVDVGPARSWDERTSGVGTNISEENKLIAVVTDKDIYLAGEEISLKFTRMTAFPVGVKSEFVLESVGARRAVPLQYRHGDTCQKFPDIESMSDIKLTLPAKTKPGRYRIRAQFCDKEWAAMPDEITTWEFEVR